MAYEVPILNLSFNAGADLTSGAFLVGTLNGSGLVVPQTTAAAGGIGIIQDAVLAGRTTAVMVSGVSKAVYGATVSAPGTKLTNDANGKLVPVSAGTDTVVAIALEAGAANEQHAVLLK